MLQTTHLFEFVQKLDRHALTGRRKRDQAVDNFVGRDVERRGRGS